MHVSPAAYLNLHQPVEEALKAAGEGTRVTQDHSVGMKDVRAATHAVWLAFQGADATQIGSTVEHAYGYALSRNVDEIRPDYRFDPTRQGTVPEAITCALEAADFEEAIRNAVSLGGDADTLAAIAGTIGEAMNGIPNELITAVRERWLAEAPDIVEVTERMYERGSCG